MIRPARAIPSRKKGARNAEAEAATRKSSKLKRKWEEKKQADAQKRARRAAVLGKLAQHAILPEQRAMLKRTSEMGVEEKRQPRTAAGGTIDSSNYGGGGVGGRGDDDSDSQEQQLSTEPSKARRRRNASSSLRVVQPRLVAPKPSSPSHSSDEEEEEEDSPSTRSSGDEEAHHHQNQPAAAGAAAAAAAAYVQKQAKAPMEASLTKAPAAQEKQIATPSVLLQPAAPSSSFTTTKVEPTAVASPSCSPVVVVRANRPPDVAASRLDLPVCGMEQEIMEAVNANPVVVLCGETGSGKSTQVPQFLIEAGFGCTQSQLYPGMIGVCQPRRVAAVSLAHRVAHELGVKITKSGGDAGDRAGVDPDSLQGCVGYQVRHDTASVGIATRVKFVTDGVLLREAKEDVLLRKYSCIIVDEAHERGINVDILLGLLSRVVPLRAKMHEAREDGVMPLKLIIMSATLSVQDFALNPRLAWNAPVVRVESRRYPVTAHFAKRTANDEEMLMATLNKVSAIHRKLPPGGVLVFLTGEREIDWFVAELHTKFPRKAAKTTGKLARVPPPRVADEVTVVRSIESDDDEQSGAEQEEDGSGPDHDEKDWGEAEDMNEKSAATEMYKDAAEGANFSASDSDEELDLSIGGPETAAGPVHALALYSRLSIARQQECFRAPPAGSRLVVVATNVAETSLTIPGIRYVVDCGRVKRKVFEGDACTMRVGWTSQASADQRMGRAGRTGPGHCYRMYSSAVYMDQMASTTPPEAATLPVDDLVLYMKTLGISTIHDFPFPTPPPAASIARGVSRLQRLGALDASERPTSLGLTMARFPVANRWAKMLVVAGLEPRFDDLLSHVVALVAHLSLAPPFQQTPGGEDAHTGDADTLRRGDCSSDALALLRAAGAFSFALAPRGGGAGSASALCARLMLSEKTMAEAASLRAQLAGVATRVLGKTVQGHGPIRPLSRNEESLVRQVVATGLIDCVAKRMDSTRARNVCVAEGALFPPRQGFDWPMETCDGQVVRLHPLSVVARSPVPAEWVVFSSLSGSGRIEGVTVVDPAWLCALAKGGSQVSVPSPLLVPEPCYVPEKDTVMCSVRPTFGAVQWLLPVERVPSSEPFPWFARALLEGKVFPGWPKQALLAAPAAHASRAPTNPRVACLVSALAALNIGSRESLLTTWKRDPKALKAELRTWAMKDGKAEWDEDLASLIRRVASR